MCRAAGVEPLGDRDPGADVPQRLVDPRQRVRREWLDEAAVHLGEPGMTPHELGHTAASVALSLGANVKAVQRMLGRPPGSEIARSLGGAASPTSLHERPSAMATRVGMTVPPPRPVLAVVAGPRLGFTVLSERILRTLGGRPQEDHHVLKRAVADAHGRSPDLQGRPGELDLAPMKERPSPPWRGRKGSLEGVGSASTSRSQPAQPL